MTVIMHVVASGVRCTCVTKGIHLNSIRLAGRANLLRNCSGGKVSMATKKCLLRTTDSLASHTACSTGSLASHTACSTGSLASHTACSTGSLASRSNI